MSGWGEQDRADRGDWADWIDAVYECREGASMRLGWIGPACWGLLILLAVALLVAEIGGF